MEQPTQGMTQDDAIALGQVPGMDHVYKFGYNDDVESGAEETIWDGGGLLVRPPSGLAMTISSGSTADTLLGTGLRTVRVSTLDDDFNEVVAEYDMDGRTGVSIESNIRVWRIEGLTAGSGGTNAGIIYVGSGAITTGVPAIIYAQINVGEGQTTMAAYTIPADRKGLLKSLTLTNQGLTTTKFAKFRLMIRDAGLADSFFRTKLKFTLANNSTHFVFDPPIELGEKHDVEVRAQAESGATIPISADFNIKLVDLPNQ